MGCIASKEENTVLKSLEDTMAYFGLVEHRDYSIHIVNIVLDKNRLLRKIKVRFMINGKENLVKKLKRMGWKLEKYQPSSWFSHLFIQDDLYCKSSVNIKFIDLKYQIYSD